jgi:hypothetical protein
MEGKGWICVMPHQHPHVIPHHHPCIIPHHPSWHLIMMCHATSTPMCHATPSNRGGLWPMVRSVDLGKCIRQSSGIVDHWWVDGHKLAYSIRSAIHQQISSMVDGWIGRFGVVYKSIVREMGQWSTVTSVDRGRCVPKCWRAKMTVRQLGEWNRSGVV